MKVLVTGANGFVGKNLIVRLTELDIAYDTFTRSDDISSLDTKVQNCDFIVHLAGVNRPENKAEFKKGNTDLTVQITNLLIKHNLTTPIIYSSSIQAEFDNPYGISKKQAEEALESLERNIGNTTLNYRLPNVFGKWCKPNYNSAVATFCHNTVNGLPIKVNDPSSVINLVYIDDVVNEFVSVIQSFNTDTPKKTALVSPVYQITVGELVNQLNLFKQSKQTGVIERVGTNLTRALYSTYISYFKPEEFTYPLVKHEDPRGIFVEMLKTKDSGQFSFFTAHPGITRGGHYHHSKNEKFLVIKGEAKFAFRHIDTDEYYELTTCGDIPVVVETVPGWSHNVTNVGGVELVVMLWANEIFNPELPDTINYNI
jgi:UDP-2-acetamido-2,6-beta-L-arabino-hexul-4-ose reductase